MKLNSRHRRRGSSLIEVLVALLIFSIGALSFLGSFYANHRATRAVGDSDEALVTLESVAETITNSPFAEIYANFEGRTIDVPNLVGMGGQIAQVRVSCFVDETRIPPQFGPLTDLDGVPASQSTDCSTTYKVLPLRLRIGYASSDGNVVEDKFFVLAAN